MPGEDGIDWERLRDYHAYPVWIVGRLHVRAPLYLRAKRVRARGREYVQYYISVPKPIAYALSHGKPPEPGGEGLPLTVYATPSPWYHLVDWSLIPMRELPLRIKKEIKALRLDSIGEPLVLIPARPEELKELGLDPRQPLTLEDIVEKVREKIREDPRR